MIDSVCQQASPNNGHQDGNVSYRQELVPGIKLARFAVALRKVWALVQAKEDPRKKALLHPIHKKKKKKKN